MTPFKTIVITLSLVALRLPALGQYAGAKLPPDDLRVGFDSFKTSDANRVLTYLATRCQGRGTGQPGFEKAARFVAKEFKKIGLKPLGDKGTYFQHAWVSTGRGIKLEVKGSNGTVEIGPSDFGYLRQFDGPVSATGLPLFAEYGGKPAALPSAGELKGRIVFFHFAHDLLDKPGEGDLIDNFIDGLPKAEPAAFFGALDGFAEFKKGLGGRLFYGPRWNLVGEKGFAYPDEGNVPVQALAAIKKVVGSGPVTVTVKGIVDKKRTENVVGLLEGTDPTLKAEYVVVGGHLDHFGVQRGVTYPGADDDGSGATDVIEIARAMAVNPVKPRRSIVFVTFFGEEQGFLGSKFFVGHSPVPLEKVVAELQMDMVSRDSDGLQQDNEHPELIDKAAENVDTMRVVGSKRVSPELDQVIRDANAFVNFRFKDDSEYMFGRSDDAIFSRKGIPTAFLFCGFHSDYHQASDTVDKIDWVKLSNAGRLYYLAAHALADRDGWLMKG